MSGANPYGMLNAQVGNYYAGPSGAALGALVAGQAIGDAFRDLGGAAARRQERADTKAQQDRAYGIQEQQAQREQQMFGWKQQEADQARLEKNRGRVATYWAVNGGENADPGGKQFMEKFGYNPYEYADNNVLSRMQDRADQRALQERMAQDRNDTLRAIAGMRQGAGHPDKYKFMPMVGPDGTTKIFAVDTTDPMAPPIEVGGAPKKGDNAQPGMLPIDTGARKNLAEWVELASDASRVSGEMDKTMGVEFDPVTGSKKYQKQPPGPFSGGTGLVLGAMNDKWANRADPEGVPVRSAISSFSSQIMKAMSGASVVDSEKRRLEGFLPTTSDSWETLRTKMSGYQDFLRGKGNAWRSTYGDHDVVNRGMQMLGGSPAQQAQQPASAAPNMPELPPGARLVQ